MINDLELDGGVVYSKNVLELFKNPKNMGEIKDADGIGMVGNPRCGDVMYMYIKVRNNRIADVKVKTFGCVAAISTSSALTEMIKGMTIEEALKVSKSDIADILGGLPPIKMHCSVLAIDALHMAVEDYRSRQGRKKK